jgi:osmoprotectant transport system permease protein
MMMEIRDWLAREHGIVLLGPLGFENAYALAMRRAEAERLGIRTIADLARLRGGFRIGGDFEFFNRPEWPALRDAYGLEPASRREFQSTFMYEAVASGEVDVISAFSSDGRIAAADLVVLEDPLGAIPPYDAIVLVAAHRAADARLRAALLPLVGSIPVELMREANQRVDRDADKASPAEAAQWLAERLRLRAP